MRLPKLAIPLYDSIIGSNGKNGRNGKTQHMRWTIGREEAFGTLKTKLRKQIRLSLPKQDNTLTIETDALPEQ
jgi:hypothetical protein